MGIAITRRQPAHGSLWMTGLDGVRRLVSVTAVPLFSTPTELVGMIALFWEEQAPGPSHGWRAGDRKVAAAVARVWGCRGSLPTRANAPSVTEATPPASRCARGTACR